MKFGASISLLFALWFAASAQAATSPNSCRYSYDTLYRDMPVALAVAVPDASEVVPGQVFHTSAGTASVELPGYLAAFGYAVGLLNAGKNDIPVKVWIAVRATNTKERVQVVGPIDVTATTTITVDPADSDRFLAATPFTYTTPVVPELTWTALGGDVVVSQDAGGSLPQLPVGTGGALRTVTGSAVIEAAFGGGASIFMDCRPGVTTGIEFDFAGPTYDPAPAAPVVTVAGPKNLMCVRSAGAELEPARFTLSATGAPAEYSVGTPYVLPPLAASTDATLVSSVTIAASNTAEGTQTVVTSGTTLPATTWTPTGAGPIRFTLAAPKAAPPYGSVQLGDAGATLDCAPAAIRIVNPMIPAPGAGRYAFDPNLDRPAFATAVNSEQPTPTPTAIATPLPTVAPAPTAVPTVTPAPVFKAPVGAIVSTRLTSRGGKVELRLRCPSGSSSCRGTITVQTAAKPIRTLTARASYVLVQGRQRTFSLKLSAAGRSAVKRGRTVKARVTIKTSAGVTATRRLNLVSGAGRSRR